MKRRVAEKVCRNIMRGDLGYRDSTLQRALKCPRRRHNRDEALFEYGCCGGAPSLHDIFLATIPKLDFTPSVILAGGTLTQAILEEAARRMLAPFPRMEAPFMRLSPEPEGPIVLVKHEGYRGIEATQVVIDEIDLIPKDLGGK
jgi:hypothetical protein